MNRMLMATSSAMSGSSTSQPVSATSATPRITPAEVHTSVIQMLRAGFQGDGAMFSAGAHQQP